ncbi:YihY family inner membrane protein [Variovorax sp. PCZ-1]|uniref:YihY family inner membrane protein n=1 Tax=Variovorax sp. PCZ-1 TaxID=2835533 RepID=UPI001BD09957|nr:YihY family inner membrane protein [Variovorax sp. PCZ-1]MBS7807044.1 YihY family inner membrane protein [Variovorax sp. PCZ-1]
MSLIDRIRAEIPVLIETLRTFPWANTAAVLRERFREDRLGLTASSLTFTTVIALVPLVTLILAIFTAFPMFAKMQVTLQTWLVQSLVPDNIARSVLGYLTQFAAKASRLGTVGLVAFVVTALALIFTIDRTLNNIWRVRQLRPFAQRLLIYWAALTLGPVLLAGSLTLTSYALSSPRGVAVIPGGLKFIFDALELALLATGMAALYHYVPNTRVKWAHAWAGGIFAAIAIEAAKALLTWYLRSVPTYSAVYGAFAAVPILLLWFYIAWVIVLFGAVIAAYLPSLLSGVARRGSTPGWNFQLAFEAIQALDAAKNTDAKGLTQLQLAARLRVDDLQLMRPLKALRELDWIGCLDSDDDETQRIVLLVNPETTALIPLAHKLLLPAENIDFWGKNGISPAQNLRGTLLNS